MAELSPRRRQILDLLDEGRTGAELAALLGRAQPNVARDLQFLHKAGLVTRHPDGYRVRYVRAGGR